MNWTCQYCKEELLSDHKARHIQRKHPEYFKPQSNNGDSMCPICHKIMHKTNVKRHMVSVHKADEDISIRQIKKQLIETGCSVTNFSNQCSLSVPLYWILIFIVLDKLWKTKKYVETSDVISSMFKFLKKIDFKPVGDFRDFLQCLQCYCYIQSAKTTTNIDDQEQEEHIIQIKHIIKGKKYPQLLQQIHSNAGTFRYWQICRRMSFKTPTMRYNKQQFKQRELSSSQSENQGINSSSDHFDSFEDCIQSSTEQKYFASVFNQTDACLWQFKKQFDSYCLIGRRDKLFLKKLDDFDKKEEFVLMLKNCHVCSQQFTSNDLKLVKCVYCSTYLHEQCSKGLNKCECQSQIIQLKRLSEDLVKTPSVMKNHLLQRTSYQGISSFKPKTSRQIIDDEEVTIKKALYERDRFIYCTSAKILNQFEVEIDLKYDPFLLQADEKLATVYQHYATGLYKPPLKLKRHAENNFGIEALETLPRMILLGEYATDIIPSVRCSQIKWKDHLMIYSQGATSRQELMLAPINICNFGPLLNHSDQGNCSSLRIIIKGAIRLLLFTTKTIKKGQELLYNYNGFHNQYPTDGFKQLND